MNKTRNKKYFCLFISYLVPGYLKGRFCYLRGFYLETNEHRPEKKKKIIRVMPRSRTHQSPMVRIMHSILTDWAINHETHVFTTVIRSFHCFKIGSYKFLAEGCSVY